MRQLRSHTLLLHLGNVDTHVASDSAIDSSQLIDGISVLAE
jgi:hypothetical protein